MARIDLEFERFADEMSNTVIHKLIGSHDEFERIHAQIPSDDIFIGSLAEYLDPKNENNEFKRRYLTNKDSIKFLVKEIKGDITVNINLYVYYRVFPTYDEQIKYNIDNPHSRNTVLVPIWQRVPLSFNEKINEKDNEIFLDFSDCLKEIKNNKNALSKSTVIPKNSLESEEKFNQEIEKLKSKPSKLDLNWTCRLKLSKRNFIQNKENYKLIDISVINESMQDESHDIDTKKRIKFYEPNLFNLIVKIGLNDNQPIPFNYDYTYENYPKHSESYSRTMNCHAEYEKKTNEFIIKGYAKYKQKKVSPKSSLPSIDITFENMSKPQGLTDLKNIHERMLEHLNKCKKTNNNEQEYLDALKNFDLMQERFKEGIELLSTEDNVFRAFSLMNKTFHENSKNKEYHSWRLFQIVFIVSLLNDITIKNHNRNVCDLLHVMTGGGKSEAYFGLVIFSAFYDRITGKEYGVTAITKFPLRMLSIQQLQRMASLFIRAEEIRTEENLGGDYFSMAYFVGVSDDFPRYNDKIINEINQCKDEGKTRRGQIIDKCPLCGGNVNLDVEIDTNLVIHKCEDCNKIFRLYFSDDEIYRTIPTLVVGTVDKFAGISQQRRVKNLYGGKLNKCKDGHGFIAHNDICGIKGPYGSCPEKGKYMDIDYDTGPTLIIQDEMHLINEAFGAIDSHFETLIETMHKEFTGNNFKNIAMTATVSGAKNQIKQLYNKDICVFPPVLKDSDGEDFFFVEEKENEQNIIQREIIGLQPNTTYVRLIFYILRYISEFIKFVEEHSEEFCVEKKFNIDDLNIILPYYKKLLTYHNKKDDVQAIPFNAYAFVNSEEYEKSYNLDVYTLTGENSLDSIKDTINTVENYYEEEEYKEDRKDKLLVVSATSIVSHGVDIDEWNTMIFDGMTRNTAEYIQALSRVGRKKCGIIFLSFKTTRLRDLSFYQNFDEYHKILDHKVEIVPLTRWPKLAFKQTLTSIFTASVLNYMSNFLERPLQSLNAFQSEFQNEENCQQLMKFIKKVYLCDNVNEESKDIIPIIEREVNDRIDCLLNSSDYGKKFIVNVLKDGSNDKYYKTQFGMRGIQDIITLEAHKKNKAFLKKYKGG